MASPSSECPLNTQYFGIISESDHRNGLCLCPLCTCKKHICPSSLSKEPYPKSMYSSAYMENFHMQRYSKPLICHSPAKAKSSQPVNFQTTTEEFYRPVFSPVQLTMPGHVRSPVPETKFWGKTSYSSNFSNWGSGGVYYVTQQHLKHTSPELGLKTKTSYSENFVEISKEELVKPRKLGLEVAAVQKNMGLRVNNAKILAESTSKRDFADFSKQSMTNREKKEYEKIPQMKNTDFHYMTVNQAEFISHPLQADHRYIRKQYEKNSKLL